MSSLFKKNHLKAVGEYDFWDNKADQSISQPSIYNMIADFMDSPDNGKKKKVAIIGWDGARADSLGNIFKANVMKYGIDHVSGHYSKPCCSGANKLIDMGGEVCLAYCGGEKGTRTEQDTSTIWGWSSILSGKWAVDNGINLPKSASIIEKSKHALSVSVDSPTILRKYAQNNNLKTAFIAQWPDHFSETYLPEIKYLQSNPDVKMRYTKFEDDYSMHKHMIDSVTEGNESESDMLIGIYESPDHNGHTTGFGNNKPHYVNAIRTCDNYTFEIIQTIENRPSYKSEDWLILISSDHGGKGIGHGSQIDECRAIFVASNKKIDSKYYSKNYDGKKCN